MEDYESNIESTEATQAPIKLTRKETVLQTVKYFIFAGSAGAIQVATFTLFKEVVFRTQPNLIWLCHAIALALSIVWNFTLNRKFTFKAASNIPKSMALAFLFYVPFFPLSTWFLKWAPDHMNPYLAEIIALLTNGLLEFLWQKFVVFGKTANTNELAKKQALKKAQNENSSDI